MTIQDLYYARKYLIGKLETCPKELEKEYTETLKAVEKLIEMMIRYRLKK